MCELPSHSGLFKVDWSCQQSFCASIFVCQSLQPPTLSTVELALHHCMVFERLVHTLVSALLIPCWYLIEVRWEITLFTFTLLCCSTSTSQTERPSLTCWRMDWHRDFALICCIHPGWTAILQTEREGKYPVRCANETRLHFLDGLTSTWQGGLGCSCTL